MIVVLVPWRPSPDRESPWQWVRSHLERLGFPIHTADSPSKVFSLAQAFNAAADRPWDRAVLSEADVFVDLSQILEALESSTELTFCYDSHVRLDAFETARFLDRPVLPSTAPIPAASQMGSNGVRVISRDLWTRLGGYDPAFVGWGAEDNDFLARARATDAQISRIPGVMYELWHDRDPAYLAGRHENRRRLLELHG